MNTDRELLELAAKAAGRDGTWVDFAGMDIRVGYQGGMLCGDADSDYYWNPLKDDGDCARMESEVGIDVKWRRLGVRCAKWPDIIVREPFNEHGGDRQAARRMASLRVAAAVGKAKINDLGSGD